MEYIKENQDTLTEGSRADRKRQGKNSPIMTASFEKQLRLGNTNLKIKNRQDDRANEKSSEMEENENQLQDEAICRIERLKIVIVNHRTNKMKTRKSLK